MIQEDFRCSTRAGRNTFQGNVSLDLGALICGQSLRTTQILQVIVIALVTAKAIIITTVHPTFTMKTFAKIAMCQAP